MQHLSTDHVLPKDTIAVANSEQKKAISVFARKVPVSCPAQYLGARTWCDLDNQLGRWKGQMGTIRSFFNKTKAIRIITFFLSLKYLEEHSPVTSSSCQNKFFYQKIGGRSSLGRWKLQEDWSYCRWGITTSRKKIVSIFLKNIALQF